VALGPDLRRRLTRLFAGLVVMGVGIACMVRSELGLAPWDVLHQGVAQRTGVPLGTVVILVGVAVLALWVPLRQRPGVGTVANALVIGAVIDLTLAVVPEVDWALVRWSLMPIGVVALSLGSGLYIGAGLGPGPRDGLMTGLAARGPSVRLVRTGIEAGALAAGWLLGGSVGLGTLVLAVSIGPLVQFFLERLSLPAPETVPAAPV
jgi:uncharacterized membrane protein YczE